MDEKSNKQIKQLTKKDFGSAGDDSTDILAVQRTLQGDNSAFSIIVDKYTPIFYTLAYRMLGDREEAEDAVQDVFLRVFKSLSKFHIGQKFYPWIYTIAVNSIRTHMRKRKRRRANELLQFEIGSTHGNTKDPSMLLEEKEGEAIAQEAIMSLKPKYREVFILRQIEGLSTSDVSDILNIPEGTVKTYLHRAKKEIINKLFQMGWKNN